MDCFNFGKGVGQGYILSSCLFNFYAEYIMLNARLDDSQAGIKIARWNINNLRYTDDIALATKISIVKAMIFPVVMHRCECWTIKKAEHWRIDAFKLWCLKTLESPLDCKIIPVNPKEKEPCILIGRTDAEAEAPILWPPDAKNWLIWKGSNAGKDWRQAEKGTTEDEMVGWLTQWT